MFFPLVVLVAVLPGLYALGRWDLNPPGPWWGLRGLAVLDGLWLDQTPAAEGVEAEVEARAFRAVAWQPPLYAWLEALGLALSPDRTPLATVLPSYVAGALGIVLVYLHGRVWRGPGLGLIAAVLTGLNPFLLVQMQQASPMTLGWAGALAALLAYAQHVRFEAGPRGLWGLLGGGALGVSLLAVGGFGLVVVPVGALHQLYVGSDSAPAARPRRGWRPWRNNPTLAAGGLALGLALMMALPWHIGMCAVYGRAFLSTLLAPPDPLGVTYAGLAGTLLSLAPATLPLGLFAVARMVRQVLASDADDPARVGGAFWLLWMAVAALLPACWSTGPRPAVHLLLLVPLNLLTAQVVLDLGARRIPVRTLIWLAPATALSVFWAHSTSLREALGALSEGHRPDVAAALGLHLGLDLLLVAALALYRLEHWARRHDARQRLLLGGFLAAVLATTAVHGLREVRFRHRETLELLALRDVILRLNQARPFTLLAVVSPDHDPSVGGLTPGGRLRFILRTALPATPRFHLTRTDELLKLPEGQRLVIVVGSRSRLPYSVQSRLGLEAIHPGRSGVLDAFATAHDTSRAVRR
jgi:hypothetical protein